MTENTNAEHVEENARRHIGGTKFVANPDLPGGTEYYAFDIPEKYERRFHEKLAYIEAMTGYQIAFEDNKIQLKQGENTVNSDSLDRNIRRELISAQRILNESTVVARPMPGLFTTHPQVIEAARIDGYSEASEDVAEEVSNSKHSLEALTGYQVVIEDDNIVLKDGEQTVDLMVLDAEAQEHLENFANASRTLNRINEGGMLSLDAGMAGQIKTYELQEACNDISKEALKSLVYNQVYVETKEGCDIKQIDGAIKVFKGEEEINPATFDADTQEKFSAFVKSAEQIQDLSAREKFFVTPEQVASIKETETTRAKADVEAVRAATPQTRTVERDVHRYSEDAYRRATSRLTERRFLDGDKIAGVRFNQANREQALANLRKMEEEGLLPMGVDEKGQPKSNAEIYLYKMAQAGKLYGTDTTIIVRDENGRRSRKEAVEALHGNHRTTIQTLTGSDISNASEEDKKALADSVLGIENSVDIYGRAIKEVPNTRRNKSYKANAAAGYEKTTVTVTETVAQEQQVKEEPVKSEPAKEEQKTTDLQSTLKGAENETPVEVKEEPKKGMKSLSGFDKATDSEQAVDTTKQHTGAENA